MASNSFGSLFRMTTWGESHGKALGVVIDGCPAGIPLTEDHINSALALRAPGKSPFTSPREEKDIANILSGVFNGVTTGTPISIVVYNHDADSSKYDAISNLMRPGHANFTYLNKYGVFDHRGGGRTSARETIGRVAAGAVAAQLLKPLGVSVLTYLCSAGEKVATPLSDFDSVKQFVPSSPVFAPNKETENIFIEEIQKAKDNKNSVGGVVAFYISGVPVGWGEPIYDKLEAKLASAIMSMPASKGFDVGLGFEASKLTGLSNNDPFIKDESGNITTGSNNCGGILGGISTGQPIYGRAAFKPTSSIFIEQNTVDLNGNNSKFIIPEGSRHDPCVAIRAVTIVEAMCWICLADAFLLNATSKLPIKF